MARPLASAIVLALGPFLVALGCGEADSDSTLSCDATLGRCDAAAPRSSSTSSATSTAASPDAAPTGSVPPGSCTPGVNLLCTCDNGAEGQTVCGSDGRAGPCECTNATAGPLVCAGRTCQGFGSCSPDGSCPPFLGECFTRDQSFDTCDVYCQSIGAQCAQSSCFPDGRGVLDRGHTWVSWPADEAAACSSLDGPSEVSFDQCRTPVWLSATKARDDIVRCCCDE